MERKGRQHCVKSAGIGFDPSTLGSILGKNRSIWFSNRRIIYTLYKGPTLSLALGKLLNPLTQRKPHHLTVREDQPVFIVRVHPDHPACFSERRSFFFKQEVDK